PEPAGRFRSFLEIRIESRSMVLKYFSAMNVGLMVVAGAPPALAESKYIALAMGKSDRLGAGLGWHRETSEGAEADALIGCQQSVPLGNCKVVLAGPDGCISLHWTLDGTSWGAAKRPTREEAESVSFADCRKAGECQLVGTWCN